MKKNREFFAARRVIRSARLTPKELRATVKKAQALDQKSIDFLCEEYKGMIINICKREHIKKVMGKKDAIQSAYVYFLQAVMAYKGNRWRTLPGLLYIYTNRMLHREYDKLLKDKNELCSLTEHNDAADEDYSTVLADSKAVLNLNIPMVKQLLTRLSPKEAAIMHGWIYEDKTLEVLAKEQNMSPRGVDYYKRKSMKKLIQWILAEQ